MDETTQTAAERFYTLLHWQLAARLPRPSGFHIYSTGRLYAGFKTQKLENGWRLIISDGVDYARFALGYKEDGTKMTARTSATGLEAFNFKTIEHCINSVSKVVASANMGGVFVDGNKLY